jgi:nucleoside-diphosphate-sugar epimerase
MRSDSSRVLVTGAFGTVGRHVVPNLVDRGHRVTCFDLGTRANRRTEQNLARDLEFDTVWADLQDAGAVRRAVGRANPHRDLAPLTSDTPVDPGDNYACHKIAGERLVRGSGLPWTILRLSGVMPLGGIQMQQPSGMRYVFLLPQERRQHGIDARDAGPGDGESCRAPNGRPGADGGRR